MLKEPRSVGTHDGTFHADEVTACALLVIYDLVDLDKIVRTRESERLARCEVVCDVGGLYDPSEKLFDHHQADYTGLLSSAGMILRYLCDCQIISDKEYHLFNDDLILGVDAHDNGRDKPVRGFSSFSNVVSNFNPIDREASLEEYEKGFFDALDLVLGHLRRLQKRFSYHSSCLQSVAVIMKRDKTCLFFDKQLAWLESFFELDGVNHPAKFVIMPAGPHWKLRAIPPSYEDRMSVRVPLPKEWAGLLVEELQEVSGIKGAIFCHKGRFISVWETKGAALEALEHTLKVTNKKS